MATTITYLSNSPHSMTLRLNGDGTLVAVAEPRATVLAATAPGPLRSLLTSVADWSVFNLGGSRSDEIHTRVGMCCTVDAGVPDRAFVFTALGITAVANVGLVNVEILMQHSERF